MAKQPGPQWSNEPDAELKAPTPHEQQLTELIEKNKSVEPKLYDITSKNPKALRVVHDYNGQTVTIPPGETQRGILLHPKTAEYLGKGDLDMKGTTP